MSKLPICENFLGGHYKLFYEANERAKKQKAKADAGETETVSCPTCHRDGHVQKVRPPEDGPYERPLVMYGMFNDLSDETMEELKAWQESGFKHVCGKEGT